MSLKVFIALERWKLFRRNLRDSAFAGFYLMALVLVLYLAFAESVISSPLWNQVDKWIHFLLFGCFTVTFLLYGKKRFFIRSGPRSRVFLTYLVLFGAGVGAELFQLYVPHRTFEWNDMAANLLGAVAFGVPYLCARPFRNDKNDDHSLDTKLTGDVSRNVLRIRQRPGINPTRHRPGKGRRIPKVGN